jgi:hypothetical protein
MFTCETCSASDLVMKFTTGPKSVKSFLPIQSLRVDDDVHSYCIRFVHTGYRIYVYALNGRLFLTLRALQGIRRRKGNTNIPLGQKGQIPDTIHRPEDEAHRLCKKPIA